MHVTASSISPFGEVLKSWRQRRGRSQLDFALAAEISQRHLSFLESGRALPSRDMVSRLASSLDLPPRQQNAFLQAAGFAPVFSERSLTDPALAAARKAIDGLLKAHEPFPALALDAQWTMVAANRSVPPLVAELADPAMLTPPVNIMRLSLHPRGLAPHIVNFSAWRAHMLARLRRQIAATGDSRMVALLEEVRAYPVQGGSSDGAMEDDLVMTLRLKTPRGQLSLLTTTTVFGSPHDVTLAEIAIETFFPADEETRAALQQPEEAAAQRSSTSRSKSDS